VDSVRFRRGEVYRAPFTYSDLIGSKDRPVCIMSADDYNRGPDVIVAMITSNPARVESPDLGDVALQDWEAAGLTRRSVLRTPKLQDLEVGLLGTASEH
jgi:hypothetical protein